MSAKLEQSLSNRQVLIRKVVSGEVSIHFRDKSIKPIILSHNGVMDLASKRGVTMDSIRESNLKELIQCRRVEVI